MTYYNVKILDARFDDENGMLVINGLLVHNGEQKVLVFSKLDIAHVFGHSNITDDNMHFFARCLSKRQTPFKFGIDDDPNREQIGEEDQRRYAMMFNKRITEDLGKITEGLQDEWGQMQRKLGRLAAAGKIDALGLLKEEMAVRTSLGLDNDSRKGN